LLRDIGMELCSTPVRSPQSNGMARPLSDEKGDLKDASYDINCWNNGNYAPIAK
jgi:hypothetical protein